MTREPTDPLAELRAIAEADGLTATTILDASRAGRLILRYLTSPEAEVEIADVVASTSHQLASRTARAVLRFIAEKAVTR